MNASFQFHGTYHRVCVSDAPAPASGGRQVLGNKCWTIDDKRVFQVLDLFDIHLQAITIRVGL